MQNMEEIIRKGLKKGVANLMARSASCPAELELARYLEGVLPSEKRRNIEKHLADCSYCLDLLVAAKDIIKGEPQAKISWFKRLGRQKWLIMTAISFTLSFMVRRYFLQFLFMALIFGIRWALSGEGSRNLVMIFRGLSHKEGEGKRSEEKIFERK